MKCLNSGSCKDPAFCLSEGVGICFCGLPFEQSHTACVMVMHFSMCSAVTHSICLLFSIKSSEIGPSAVLFCYVLFLLYVLVHVEL